MGAHTSDSGSHAVKQVRLALGSDAYLLVDEGPANMLGPDVLDAIAGQVVGLFVVGAAAGVQGRAEQWSGEALDWLRGRLRKLVRRDTSGSVEAAESNGDLEAELRTLSNADKDTVLRFAEMSEAVTAAVLTEQGMTARRAAAVAARAREASLAAVGAA